MLFVVFPIIWVFLMSLKAPLDLVAYPPRFIFQPIYENYAAVLELDIDYSRLGMYAAADVDFLSGYGNSLMICTGALVLAAAVSIPAAYALARLDVPWKEQIGFTLLGVRFVPEMALAIPLYIVFLRFKLYDTIPGLVLAYQSFMVPFMVWTMQSYFQEVPEELGDAARVDGCSAFQVFRHIFLPIAAPGLASVGALAFIFAWNNFSFGLILSRNIAQPVTVKMLGYITYTATLWGQLAAASMLVIIPQLIVGAFIQRYIVRGLTYGIH
jgi:multiple sugar transport system permease protein